MIKFPIHGFAKRAEDTVPKAMAIIRAKEAAANGERAPSRPSRKQNARGRHA
jgi:hypothetical protein